MHFILTYSCRSFSVTLFLFGLLWMDDKQAEFEEFRVFSKALDEKVHNT